jgi:hypothetical protein
MGDNKHHSHEICSSGTLKIHTFTILGSLCQDKILLTLDQITVHCDKDSYEITEENVFKESAEN